MAEYDNTNTFVLFKNDKATSDKAPQYKGKMNVDGKDYEIAAWVKEGKSGKFMSGKVQEPYTSGDKGQVAARSAKSEPAGGFDDMDDDIPF